MTLTVHHLQVSQSERIVWLAEELGLEYKLVIHKRDPFQSPQSIKDLNPLGQAPVIQDSEDSDSGSGSGNSSITLAESGAIAEYILHKHDPHNEKQLRLGPSHKDYAQYLYWFHFANGNLHPQLTRVMVLKLTNVDPDKEWHARRHFHHLDKFLRFMDAHLADREWLVGTGKEAVFTAADIMNVFPLTTMRTFTGLDLSPYKNILAWLGRCTQREAYRRYRAKADPELELMIDGPPPAQFLQKLKEEGKAL